MVKRKTIEEFMEQYEVGRNKSNYFEIYLYEEQWEEIAKIITKRSERGVGK